MVFDIDDSEFERMTLETSNFCDENVVIGNIHSIFFTAGEPTSGGETLKVLNDCIDAYEANFENRMKTKPFTDVFEILQELKKEKKEALRWPFLDFFKTLDYDKIYDLITVFGGERPPKKYVEKIKSGSQFNLRFKKFIMSFDFVKFNMDDFYSSFDALNDAPDGDLTAYYDSIFLVNLYAIALRVCTSLYQYENKKKEILEKNVANFILVAVKLCAIKQYKASKDHCSILQALLLLTELISFDIVQVQQIIFSGKLLKKMQSIVASKERKKGWKPLDEYYDMAVKSAIEYWEKKDKRLHHEMANDLISEINGPVIDKIRKELLKKYSNKDPGKENEDAYKKELKKRISYETMSARTLKKKLQPIAIKYKKFYDPGSRAKDK